MKIKEYKRTYTDEWDFRTSDTKEYTHSYHTYPAMMIPQIARKLIQDYKPKGKLENILDPYMGSGTTLVEAKIQGINAIGTDLNPLARFISSVKTTNFNEGLIEKYFSKTINAIENYKRPENVDLDHITNVDFWYSKENAEELYYLTNIINTYPETIRDFFLLALSECVREVSYTRNGEFKRYRIAKEKLHLHNPQTFKLFINKIERNIKGLEDFNKINNKSKVVIADFNTVNEIPKHYIKEGSVDLVVTSPPYGDSKTTVAYGQFSRWANEWFKFENAKKIDNLLMGGTKIKDFTLKTESIKNELKEIKAIDEKRYYEVLSFLDDYYKSITNVSKAIRKEGRICYVVGNRNVKGVQIPLDYFTIEAFEANDFKHIDTFVRSIPNKRMPNKTSPSNKKGANVTTMVNEFIIIMEKI
ncbi:DNA methyltransferase [Marixanthomonas sp. SCSIO 43207]|uniref:DNA methyltransferase n=1 Tax=Marixanthomonas sp. SCSIO 43207 TaxID=2779360 RepID=UPI001CA84E66|nr:DNA methyltransferase [Marixanthomonas sp. SCSIO 43207]UAB82273.1 DNA methyltransferase [Marixanthomonas sp. SCSIO 43207]